MSTHELSEGHRSEQGGDTYSIHCYSSASPYFSRSSFFSFWFISRLQLTRSARAGAAKRSDAGEDESQGRSRRKRGSIALRLLSNAHVSGWFCTATMDTSQTSEWGSVCSTNQKNTRSQLAFSVKRTSTTVTTFYSSLLEGWNLSLQIR